MTYDLAIIGGGPSGVSAGVYAARKRPPGTFDLLSPIVLPNGHTTQSAALPAHWHVVGLPRMAIDPRTKAQSTFVVESISTYNGIYSVIARNVGGAPAPLVADVPYLVDSTPAKP